MKVYIVQYDTGYDFNVFSGVFSSMEKAQAFIDTHDKSDRKYFFIEDYVVDEI